MDDKNQIAKAVFSMTINNVHRRPQISQKVIYSSKVIGSLALVLLLMSGCDSAKESAYEAASTEEGADYASEDSASVESVESEQVAAGATDSDFADSSAKLKVENLAGDSEQSLGSQITDIEIEGKTLLVTANANFKVADVVKSSDAIESLTRQQGGYVALSNTTNIESDSRTFTQGAQIVTLTTYYRQATMTVRIPREKVSAFLKQVQQQVAFLNEQEFSAQDVTLDIYREQLAAKLNSDMASELAQERLNSENAKDQRSNVDSITATYSARQQQQYAQLQQMDIADKVKYSTIELTFTQPNSNYKETTQNLDMIVDAERPSFGSQVSESFKTGWEMLRSVVLGIIQLWWLVILFGVFYLLYRVIKTTYRKLFRNKSLVNTVKRKELFGNNKEKDGDIK